MANCKNCGGPLKKGNIKVVRPRGKKRPYRVCRRCPDQARSEAVQLTRIPAIDLIKAEAYQKTRQRPQEGTGGPIVVEGIFTYPEPPKYRYFITRAAAEKLQRMSAQGGGRAAVELIPVPDYQVEADPEALNDYIEIEVNWPTG